jgi:hypothetical protein
LLLLLLVLLLLSLWGLMLVSVFGVRTVVAIRPGDKKEDGGCVGVLREAGVAGAAGGGGDGGGGRSGGETGIARVEWQHGHLDGPFGFLVLNGEDNHWAAATWQNFPWTHLALTVRYSFLSSFAFLSIANAGWLRGAIFLTSLTMSECSSLYRLTSDPTVTFSKLANLGIFSQSKSEGVVFMVVT